MTALPLAAAARARRAALSVALCAGLAATLTAVTGCSEDPDAGTNGVGRLDAPAIEEKARTAAGGAQSVRLAGTLVSKGGTYKLNMRLKKTGGSGSVTTKSSTFELLRADDALYLKADADFWKQAGASGVTAAEKLDDKYVKVPQDDPTYKQLRGFTEMDVLLDGVLGLHGELSKGGYDAVDGVRTIKVLGGEGNGGTLDVSLQGTPYPLRFARAGGAGLLTLADWDEDFALAPPEQGETVDYGQELPRKQ
ncbi:hypothetical protein ABZ532_02550 [Streptomyces sp. NPDC019396]|uniref:hypothetical protein n=1 Tax=Streptomyces sp. NPDC019396 TaxID=3154687 RepID=UPI0033DB32BD